jgi:hypothetical protein
MKKPRYLRFYIKYRDLDNSRLAKFFECGSLATTEYRNMMRSLVAAIPKQ